MTYPVARIRSMTPRIFRRYALWVGSDSPTPSGSCKLLNPPLMFDNSESGVVANEPIDETEDALPLWDLVDIRRLDFPQAALYAHVPG